MKVIKRDGSTVDFDRSKIVVAIQKPTMLLMKVNALPKTELKTLHIM